jgi:hypothetical protein
MRLIGSEVVAWHGQARPVPAPGPRLEPVPPAWTGYANAGAVTAGMGPATPRPEPGPPTPAVPAPVQASHRPGHYHDVVTIVVTISDWDVMSQGLIVHRTLRPREASSKGRIVHGTQHYQKMGTLN